MRNAMLIVTLGRLTRRCEFDINHGTGRLEQNVRTVLVASRRLKLDVTILENRINAILRRNFIGRSGSLEQDVNGRQCRTGVLYRMSWRSKTFEENRRRVRKRGCLVARTSTARGIGLWMAEPPIGSVDLPLRSWRTVGHRTCRRAC